VHPIEFHCWLEPLALPARHRYVHVIQGSVKNVGVLGSVSARRA
jgi:hypothetical protein